MSLIKRLNHADVIIPRGAEDKAREFYCKLLGFQEIPKPDNLQKNGGLWLQLGEMQIHLSIQDGYDPRITKAHLAYEVTSLYTLRELLQAHGITMSDNSPVPGFIRGDIRDPFGNRMEFLEAVESEVFQ